MYKFKTKQGVEYVVNDEPVHRLLTAKDLYNLRLASGGDKIVSLFGYSGEEILNIIEEHERNKFKMTREEAKKKLDACFRLCASDVDIFIYLFADKCVNALMQAGYKIVLDKK